MASRWGIASILVLFIVGAILFYFVDEEKGRQQAALLEAD
jgi:UMF1 family MFS transporter